MPHLDPDLLRHVPLLKTLTQRQLVRLTSAMKAEAFRSDQVLVSRGQSGDAFYVLGEGSAQVTVDDVVVGWIYRYDFFGELALLGEGHRLATVTALEPGVVWSMDRRTFAALERDAPEIAQVIHETALERQQRDARMLVR